ncbi:KxYKxGKxW signal peptide domain-containing protein [Candidatus Omnitrophota bacterium]
MKLYKSGKSWFNRLSHL